MHRFLPEGRFAISDSAIAEWFASVCTTPPVNIPRPTELGVFGGRKRQKYVKGWWFRGGSTRQWVSADSAHFLDAAISMDGHRLYTLGSGDGFRDQQLPLNKALRGEDRLNGLCLAELANMANLPLLPEAAKREPGEDAAP